MTNKYLTVQEENKQFLVLEQKKDRLMKIGVKAFSIFAFVSISLLMISDDAEPRNIKKYKPMIHVKSVEGVIGSEISYQLKLLGKKGDFTLDDEEGIKSKNGELWEGSIIVNEGSSKIKYGVSCDSYSDMKLGIKASDAVCYLSEKEKTTGSEGISFDDLLN